MATELATTDLTEMETAPPPRAQIVRAPRVLFYKHGIRAVGVEAIAEAADTNKTTLYRHFASKDELVAERLREYGKEFEAYWAEIERA
jgi:AcrR family transcriptional regulator